LIFAAGNKFIVVLKKIAQNTFKISKENAKVRKLSRKKPLAATVVAAAAAVAAVELLFG